MKFAYYNEFDPKAAAWIKQLIKNGMIADGEVDERSITEVTADEIRGFTQHHFFAGIGGWSYSLRLAGWADDRPVCTASLPCQPFSVAGAQKGVDDDRHLLPHFIELVKHCNFQTIFGEQVPGAIKHGWLDDLCTEMEREKYRVGQIVLTAAGEGAPHIRQRLYWVADSINKGSQGRLSGWQDQEREIVSGYAGCSGTVGGLSNPENGYGGGRTTTRHKYCRGIMG
jgi:DNA (cytosine-5)-methyltransferase 1